MCADQPISLHQLEQIAQGLIDDPILLARVHASPELSERLEQIRKDNELLAELMTTGSKTPELDTIGGYELLGEIHRGGQGVVYKARQKATDRLVAVKTLIQGAFATETQRIRFEREVRLAARLKHPSIVTVHESGRTPLGTNYIALELVEGERLDEYARPLRERGDLRAIAALFSAICDAIRYAHQRGVIHRDLKPGNVLVDSKGVPHVLDFGIAKGFDEEAGGIATTRTGEFVGTLAYAAPEQLSRDADLVDVRIDIYALGVMLYEACTGERPVKGVGALSDIIARIITQPPTPPRALNPRIDRDLETIILTALAKQPRERYQTAGDLRDDLEAWLHGRAIKARAHDFWYLARKTVIRYRVAASIAGAFLVLIIASAVVATVLSMRVQREAARVQRENLALMQNVTAVSDALDRIDGETSMESVNSLSEFLVTLLHEVETNVKDRPDVEAPLRDAVGSAYLFQEKFADAERELLKAQALRRQMYQPPHPALARSLHNLGRLRFKQARYAEAEQLYRSALAMRTELFGLDHDDVARTMHHLAATLQELGNMSEAGQYWQQALAIRKRILPPDDSRILNTFFGVTTFQMLQGDYRGARESMQEVLAAIDRNPSLGPQSLPAGRVTHNLGLVLTNLGEYQQARLQLERSKSIKEKTEPKSESYARTLAELGRNHLLEGSNLAEARLLIEQSLRLRRERQASGDQIAESLRLLAEVELAEGRAVEALALADQAVEALQESSRPPGHWESALLSAARARILAALQRHDEACAECERADSIMTRLRTDDDPDVRRNLGTMLALYERSGRTPDLERIRARLSAPDSTTAAKGEQPE
ncbi:MAG: serine/threonine protein kinase [Leptolyngbya sp. PLA3]|nr:MAG: serine/threonine protein kinase [Cyanobacteria bacterium CYA]MCE7968044.1 serine/threonine protein kinase [Leptolyngbya sp. PL-A3]